MTGQNGTTAATLSLRGTSWRTRKLSFSEHDRLGTRCGTVVRLRMNQRERDDTIRHMQTDPTDRAYIILSMMHLHSIAHVSCVRVPSRMSGFPIAL